MCWKNLFGSVKTFCLNCDLTGHTIYGVAHFFIYCGKSESKMTVK